MTSKTIALILTLTTSTILFGQTKMEKNYICITNASGYLTLSKNNYFRLSDHEKRKVHRGTWTLTNDTLVLKYSSYKNVRTPFFIVNVSGLFHKKHYENETDTLVIKGTIIRDVYYNSNKIFLSQKEYNKKGVLATR